MSIDFFEEGCKDFSDKKRFGLCDDRPNERAYIDTTNGAKWIAVVDNEDRHNVTFTAVDHCITILREDGKMDSRCDGFLTHNSTIIFVELKERGGNGPQWVKDGEIQLRTTIEHFEATIESEEFTLKKAYIGNSEHPKFKESQKGRMDQFFNDTGYVLRVENRIVL